MRCEHLKDVERKAADDIDDEPRGVEVVSADLVFHHDLGALAVDVTHASACRADGYRGCLWPRGANLKDDHYAIPGIPDMWNAMVVDAVLQNDQCLHGTNGKGKRGGAAAG